MISLKSEITKKLLSYFFLNPKESLYVNELSRNLKFYSINKNYPLYNEYRKIVIKTIGLEKKLRDILKDVKAIKDAYIYGSYANNKMDTHSDIDLLVVGSHSIILLQKKLNKLQREINREINVVNMNEREFKKKIINEDSFIIGILKKKHIKINS